MRRALAAILLAALTLSGCTLAPRESAAPKITSNTVKVMVLGGAGLESTLFATFTAAYPDVKPETVPLPEGDFPEIIRQIKSGEVKVDAIVAPANNFLFSQDLIMPLDDMIKQEKLSVTEYGSALEFGKYQGKTYGLPVIMSPMVVVYNQDLFTQAGLKLPTPEWTWEEFDTAAQSLAKLMEGKEKSWGLAVPPWTLVDLLLSTGQGPAASDLSDMQTALGRFGRLYNGQKVMANEALGASELDYFSAFARKELGMLLTYWENSFGHARPDFNYGVAPLPGGKTPATATLAMAVANAEHKDTAAAFVKIVGGAMGSQAIGRMPGSPVPGLINEAIKQMWTAHAPLKDKVAFMMNLSYVAPMEYPEALVPLLLQEADAAISGKKKPEEAIKSFQEARTPHMSKK